MNRLVFQPLSKFTPLLYQQTTEQDLYLTQGIPGHSSPLLLINFTLPHLYTSNNCTFFPLPPVRRWVPHTRTASGTAADGLIRTTAAPRAFQRRPDTPRVAPAPKAASQPQELRGLPTHTPQDRDNGPEVKRFANVLIHSAARSWCAGARQPRGSVGAKQRHTATPLLWAQRTDSQTKSNYSLMKQVFPNKRKSL